ncbi:MAG: formate acetyltransferase [Polyangiaceae bacterium]|nr:formate acetyltransferase [Polyangiaceae bacterium]
MTALDSPRLRALDAELRAARHGLCAERALSVTRYFRERSHRHEPLPVRKAEALARVLADKTVRIHAEELLVGNFTSYRVGGGLYPELHGVAVLEDLFAFERRAVNPFTVAPLDQLRLLVEVVPYWLPRMMSVRGRPPLAALRFLADQLEPTLYLLNETGGVSHFVPDYEALVTRGTDGLRALAEARLREVAPGSPEAAELRAMSIALEGLAAFAERYRDLGVRLAGAEPNPERRRELETIAATCAEVPRRPARSFREGLQAILFGQIALNLESLDSAVSPGRLDQILWPLYERDLRAGRLDRAGAFELLGCFALKLCEIVPVFSRRITRFHGGLFNGQVVVVGGQRADGTDATNELTLLWLELMAQLRTRQPNYHARLHAGTPPSVRERVAHALAGGAGSPALYNDEVIVPMLRARGMSTTDALDYATVGCVEPVSAGRSFLSTDAALVNLPLCLELALNEGRRFGRRQRVGAATPPAADARSIDEVVELFRVQLAHATEKLLTDLGIVEEQNRRYHPTPLTSALLQGCIASGRDATAGGATYNGSGVQGVGAVEVGDSLAALARVVFEERRATMAEVVTACRQGFRGGEALRARLRRAPKYGSDDPAADRYTARVMELWSAALAGRATTRGGEYVPGFYSVTAHQAFGAIVGALPSGRPAGVPFSSGLSPSSGAERRGPTAALLSQAALPLALAKNGLNFNLQLPPLSVAGDEGGRWLAGLLAGAVAAGCMQVQVNVLDHRVLCEARDRPGSHPGLVVRVSGYSAYFDDLSPEMQQEVIDRLAAA